MDTIATDILLRHSETGMLPTFKVDPTVERIYRNALAYLVFKWPLLAQMIYSDMEIEFTVHVPIAATDSKIIYINPDGFVRADITDVLEIVYVEAHEVYHRILYDIVLANGWKVSGVIRVSNGKELPYDDDLMNKAMDYRINASLNDSKIGRMPKCGLYDATLSEKGYESCVEIYEKLWTRNGGFAGYRKRKADAEAGKIFRIVQGQPGGGGFDIHLPPRPKQVEADRGKREQAIIAAYEVARRTNPGSIPGMLKRIIDEIIEPKVEWDQHLRATMTRKVGVPRLDWTKQDRRLASRSDPMYAAAKGKKGCGPIAIFGDNSGSITNKVTNVFGAEMLSIVKQLSPSMLIVMWCDANITRLDVFDDPTDLSEMFEDWKTTGIGGGGGTDFRPPFKRLEKMGIVPEMAVYLTDMAGRFPEQEPPYPVIWASISKSDKAPFGELVHVEI